MDSYVFQVHAEQEPFSKKRHIRSMEDDYEYTGNMESKRQKIFEFAPPASFGETEVEIKMAIQQHFEEIGNLHVELGMKKSEVMRWKERALHEHQSVDPRDFKRGNEIFAQLTQTLLPLESELLRLQHQLRFHNEEIEKLRLQLQTIQRRAPEQNCINSSMDMQDVPETENPIVIPPSPVTNSVWRDIASIFSASPFRSTRPSSSIGPSPIMRSASANSELISGVDGPPDWHKDQEHRVCEVCSNEFGLFVRKHHCRKCGRVVCDNCSKRKLPLPQYNMPEPVRICRECEPIVLEYHRIMQRQQNFTQKLMESSVYTAASLPANSAMSDCNDVGWGGHLSRSASAGSPSTKRRTRRN